jgi:hypothetical protein
MGRVDADAILVRVLTSGEESLTDRMLAVMMASWSQSDSGVVRRAALHLDRHGFGIHYSRERRDSSSVRKNVREAYGWMEVDRTAVPRPLSLTKKNDVHALTLKLLHALLPRLDVPVVRIVDDDLTSLDCEEVPDLVLYLGLYAPPEGVGRFGSGCWGCQRRSGP